MGVSDDHAEGGGVVIPAGAQLVEAIHAVNVGGGAAPAFGIAWSGPHPGVCAECRVAGVTRSVTIHDREDEMDPPVFEGELCQRDLLESIRGER